MCGHTSGSVVVTSVCSLQGLDLPEQLSLLPSESCWCNSSCANSLCTQQKELMFPVIVQLNYIQYIFLSGLAGSVLVRK